MSIVTVLAAVGSIAVAAVSLIPRSVQPGSSQTTSSEQPAFVCRLDALTPRERSQQAELRTTLERGTTQVTDDPEGYTFHFAADVAPATVIAWVEMERKCCPFLRFTLDIPENEGPSRLRVWGAPGVKAFVATEMNVGA